MKKILGLCIAAVLLFSLPGCIRVMPSIEGEQGEEPSFEQSSFEQSSFEPSYPNAGQTFVDEGLPDITVLSADEAEALLYAVDGSSEFELTDSESDDAGQAYRFSQTYDGIPIYGAQRVVVADADGKPLYVAGDSVPGVDIGAPVNTMTFDEAAALAAQSVGAAEYTPEDDGLWWYFNPYEGASNAYQLVYSVTLTGVAGDGSGVNTNVLIDAVSGMVYRQTSSMQALEEIRTDATMDGETFTTLYTDYDYSKPYQWNGSSYDYTGVRETGSGRGYALIDMERHISVLDLRGGNGAQGLEKLMNFTFPQEAWNLIDDNNNWNDGNDTSENIEGVKTYLNVRTAYKFNREHGIRDLDGVSLSVFVRAGTPNSFANGNNLIFGKGLGPALDVVGHEFTHMLIEDRLDYFMMPGALNESLANVFGALIEDKPDDTDFLNMGEDISNLGYSFFSIFNGADATHMDQYKTDYEDNGEVHINAGIPDKVFADLYYSGQFTRDELITLYCEMIKGLTPFTNFWQARHLMLNACVRRFSGSGGKYDEVAAAWNRVGVSVGNEDDHSNFPYYGNKAVSTGAGMAGVINYAADCDCFRFIPQNNGFHEFTLTRDAQSAGSLDFLLLDKSGNVISYCFGTQTDADVSSELTSGETYYLVVTGDSPQTRYTVSVSMEAPQTGIIGGDLSLMYQLLQSNRDKAIALLGEDYSIEPIGAEGWMTGYVYPELGMTLAFEEDSAESMVQYIECNETADIAGANVGMAFIDIQNILGSSQAYVTQEEAGDVWHLDYSVGGLNIDFYAFQEGGPADGAVVTLAGAAAPPEEQAGYLIPGSDSRYITLDDLDEFDAWTARLARNEIFARYGFTFETPEIQAYFESTGWYVSDPSCNGENGPTLNAYEEYNVQFIKDYEASLEESEVPTNEFTMVSIGGYVNDDYSNFQFYNIQPADGGYMVACKLWRYAVMSYDQYEALIAGETVDTEVGLLTYDGDYSGEYGTELLFYDEYGDEFQISEIPEPGTSTDITWMGQPTYYKVGDADYYISSDAYVYCIDEYDAFTLVGKTFEDYLSTGGYYFSPPIWAQRLKAEISGNEILSLEEEYES